MRHSSGLRATFATARVSPDDPEAGDTLIEVLIALLILSITVVALLSAFTTSVTASSEYRNLAATDSILRTISEEVIGNFQQGTTYLACPNGTPSNYTQGYNGSQSLASTLAIPAPYTTAGYSAAITAVGYWNGSNFTDTSSTCSQNSAFPEQLTVSINGPSGVSESLAFLVEGSGQVVGGVQLDPPTNVQLATPSSDSGGLTVTFTGSANAPATTSTFTQYYTVTACTVDTMTSGCTTASSFQSGDEVTGLVADTPYWVEVVANASPGYLASSPSAIAGPQNSSGLPQFAVTSVIPSSTVAGALTVTFQPPANPASGETYTGVACTDSGMTQGCVSVTGFSPSPSQNTIPGLVQGTSYYVEVKAIKSTGVPDGSTSPYSPPVPASVQLTAPVITNVASSAIQSGTIVVYFSPSSNAPSTQTYTATACTDSQMMTACKTQSSYQSGQQFGGLNAGSAYYVQVLATASTGYLAAQSAVYSPPTMATIQLSPPTITSVSPANTGQLTVTYSGSNNAPTNETYTLQLCTNTNMTSGCLTKSNYVSGKKVTGLTSGATYYATVTANAISGYLASAPSAVVSGTAG